MIFSYYGLINSSSSLKYIISLRSNQDVVKYVDKMKAMKPNLKMRGEAYHYEKKRKRRRGSKRKSGTERVKVTSMWAEQNLDFATWEDVSGDYSQANLAFSNITRQDFS